MPKNIGLDLGTANTRMYVKGKGIILRSPTVVTVDKYDDKVIALGASAKKMIGRTPSGKEAYRPIRNGVIADFDVSVLMLHEYFVKTESLSLFNRPIVLTSVPANCTEVERLALENAIFSAGAKAVGVVKAPIAAAIGAGLRINSARGCMIVDIGAGHTQIAVISSGGIICSRTAKIGGDAIDNAIIHDIKSKKKIIIGEATAESTKVQIGSALPGADRGRLEVVGINEIRKCAQAIYLGSDDIYRVINSALGSICRTIVNTLEVTPPEIAGDISSLGIMLVGGGANIPGISEYISKETGLRVTIAKNPMDCECIGIGKLIENPGILQGGILYKNR